MNHPPGSMHHIHDHVLIALSIGIAIFASYTALDLANSVSMARGRARSAWLFGGSIAMGVGIWSMHFVGMLAFQLAGASIAYDIGLMILSIVVAIFSSALALNIVSRDSVSTSAYLAGSLTMGTAIAGMHYLGIASMRTSALWKWDYTLVTLSIVIAVTASFVALQLAFRLREDISTRRFWYRGAGAVVMGLAVAGMHYTGMAAMTFYPGPIVELKQEQVLATSGLAVAIIAMTLVILGIALLGSIVDRAFGRRDASIQARDDFLSIASHELKTPITSMKLRSQLRLRKLQTDKDKFSTEALSDMFSADEREIDRLARLIDSMLDISRINCGKLMVSPESVDLIELVHDVIERHRPQLEHSGCDIHFASPQTTLITGSWDRFRIEQVITNLLTNAMRYGSRKPIHVNIDAPTTNRVLMTVRDEGHGIASTNHQRIFDRFERAVDASEVSGLGLGLYIAKQIVELHHGRIWVESQPENGATFFVDLPVNGHSEIVS